MWGSADGGPPEVTLETSMGPFTVEVVSFPSPLPGPFPLRSIYALGSLSDVASAWVDRRCTTSTPPRLAGTLWSSPGEAITTTSSSIGSSSMWSRILSCKVEIRRGLEGVVNPSTGYPKFEDDIRPELKHTGAGIISMANAGPNTNGSQFFITLAPCQSLDEFDILWTLITFDMTSGKHTIFGRVSSGMEVIKRLGSVQTDNNDRWVMNCAL
ncbi:hypothetical protein GW17_00039335 [Ensete ventricosum]|nr:hypothetical protein GW17_00039335 [Ensete ventricosum]